MIDNNYILDNKVYSYSCLNSFYNCPYGWYLTYIELQKTCGNFFSDYGKIIHTMLEKYVIGELTIFDLNDFYNEEFKKIQNLPPKNKYVDIAESYYNLGLDYINNIDLILDDYDVLGIEKKVEFTICNKKFVGYIDLLLRNKETKKITIVDHKSRKISFLKDGVTLNSKSRSDVEDYKKQLYLYSIPVQKEYGEFPETLSWNHFNSRLWNHVSFDYDEYQNTIEWASKTLDMIYAEEKWLPNDNNEFFCNNLCGQRNNGCEYKKHR